MFTKKRGRLDWETKQSRKQTRRYVNGDELPNERARNKLFIFQLASNQFCYSARCYTNHFPTISFALPTYLLFAYSHQFAGANRTWFHPY